jgi:hypothetical protein
MADDRSLPNLHRWLRAVELEPASEREAALQSAAFAVADTVSHSELLDIVLLAHGVSQDNSYQRIYEAVRNVDPTFTALEPDLETHLAAGTSVAAMFTSDALAVPAAHATLAALWLGLEPAIADLPALARKTLTDKSEVLRGRRPLPTATPTDRAFGEVPAFAGDGEYVYSQDGRAVVAGAKKAATSLRASIDRLGTDVTARLSSLDEELNVLWWAFSGYSERGRVRWSEFDSPAGASLVLGLELGTLFRFGIEAPSMDALVVRLLGEAADTTVTLGDAIESGSDVAGDIETSPGHQLFPVLSSLAEYRTLSGKPAWRTSVSRWSLNPKHASSASELACEVVREVISARTFSV